jgi:CRP-like cAMP-binding protein
MRNDAAANNGSTFVLDSSLIHALDPVERERLRPLLERVALPQGRLLAAAGERTTDLWFPNGAIVSAVVRLADGEAVEAGLVGAEGIIGVDRFLGTENALLTAIVQVPGDAYRCRMDALAPQLAEFPSLQRTVLRYAGALLASIAQVAACNATHSLRQRMARWLLMAHDRAGRDRFRLTHEFIAAMINVRRAGVSQFASEMRDAGAIAYTRGEIRVVDRRVLEGEACECYAVIRRLVTDLVPDMVR